MLWFCRHRWSEHERFYTPPQPAGWLVGDSMENKALTISGFTTIVDRCTVCGKLRKHRVAGKAVLGRPADSVDKLLSDVTQGDQK